MYIHIVTLYIYIYTYNSSTIAVERQECEIYSSIAVYCTSGVTPSPDIHEYILCIPYVSFTYIYH